jgi:hypothetical protein
LPPEAHQALCDLRKAYPSDFFVMCNQNETEQSSVIDVQPKRFSIPELVARRETFVANIFQGIRPFEGEPGEHFFPWSADRCRPAIRDIQVEVVRTVMFRPFAHHQALPDYATYLLFGRDDEAHMTNLQTARLATGRFEAPSFGPDYDHVMSLAGSTRDWLEDVMLEAGVVVTVPSVRLTDPTTGAPTIPCDWSFRKGDEMDLMYRGLGPARPVVAGHSFLFCTAVCNSPDQIPCPPDQACHISLMPEKYWT